MGIIHSGFDWDEGNREKCQKHGVSLVEVELLFSSNPLIGPDIANSMIETRYRAIGRIGESRAIFAVFTLRDRDGMTLIRPISARFMHAKEVAFYDTFNTEA
jgi:uncharacterized protein